MIIVNYFQNNSAKWLQTSPEYTGNQTNTHPAQTYYLIDHFLETNSKLILDFISDMPWTTDIAL